MKTQRFKLLSLLILMILSITACSTKNEEPILNNTEPDVSKNIKTTSEKDGFTINVINSDFSISENLVKELIMIFHEVYPKMVTEFNNNAAKSLDVIIDTAYDGVAYAEIDENKITISSKYINSKLNDTDLLTHELMHIIQSYSHGGPGWLIEGIADYARYVYGVNNAKAGWSLPSYAIGQNYMDGYGTTASFLKWIKLKYDDAIINKVDSNLRDGTYTYSSWVENTGYTLPDLWLLYSGKPVGDKDLTIEAMLKVSNENIDGINAQEGSLKLIDGDLDSKFLIFDFSPDFWMQQEFSKKTIIDKYILTSGNDAPERDPKDWVLSGSDDELSWTELDIRNAEVFNNRNQSKEYSFNATVPYKYYRISITANKGAPIFQLSEWRLYKKK